MWQVFAEVIGTYLLVFVGSGSAGLSVIDESRVSKLAASLAAGLIVTVLIYSIGHISGAHMNPAVSLAFAAVRHFPWPQVRPYKDIFVFLKTLSIYDMIIKKNHSTMFFL